MKLLLDTHSLLWLADGDPRLSEAATNLMLDPTNDLFVSMASMWEIASKVGLGKLTLTTNCGDYLNRAISGYGISILDVAFDDCVRYAALPFPNTHHRDPFDRMIVVHALRQSMSIISIDDKLDGYGVTRRW